MPERMLRVFNGRSEFYAQHIGPEAVPVLTADGDEFTVTVFPDALSAERAGAAAASSVPAVSVETFKTGPTGKGRQPYFFRVRVSANGEIIAPSEGYARKKDRDERARVFADLFGVELTPVEA